MTTEGNKGPSWGRAEGKDWKSIMEVSFLFVIAPALVIYYFVVCDSYDCSLSDPVLSFWDGTMTLQDFFSDIPVPTFEAGKVLFIWIAFQAFLYMCCPGPTGKGQETPAGHVLDYNLNGLNAWILSHVLFIAGSAAGVFPATIVYDHWGPLLILCNILGFSLGTYAYIKAHFFPTHPNDVKLSGTFIYDYFMGAEMNPRIGQTFDFKLFFNGRPGIVAWTLIDLSFMAAQLHNFGYVTNSMVLVILLHAAYVLDFFWNEDWYLKTIDIAHDHYGWYLAWGDVVWLPWMYTLQAYYLTKHPVSLSVGHTALVIFLGCLGYYVFRDSNNQRHEFRKSPGSVTIWGKPATYIKASYTTSDGVSHQSNLLTSGYWGMSRHFNYFGDLIFSFSSCFACGTTHFFPYFYFVNMVILLLWRIERDNGRCKRKYGAKWDEYCEKVPYKLIPYVY